MVVDSFLEEVLQLVSAPLPLGTSDITNTLLGLADGMFYTRGSSEDLDRFAAVSGEEGWTWDNMRPYFDKVRRTVLSYQLARMLKLCFSEREVD